LLEESTCGIAFDERIWQQLSYEQMIAFTDILTGWTLGTEVNPKRSAWLAGFSEGLMAEANQLGSDWNPPKPYELTVLRYMDLLWFSGELFAHSRPAISNCTGLW
jgi:hypothetical protein